jgi:pentose-5-phosphate-3-epimerase
MEVDGNLDVDSSRRCIRCGATILVGGTSSIFKPGMDVFSAFTQFQSEIARTTQQADEVLPT